MNYIKLLTDVLKARDKEKTRGVKSPYLYGYYEKYGEKYIAISVYGHMLVFIPEKFFYLDIEKCFDQVEPLHVDKIINDDHAVDTYTDGIVKPVGGDPKHKIQIFSNDKADIWIAVDLLKLFDLSIAHFKASDKKSPLYIYEDETLVGMVLPVNHA